MSQGLPVIYTKGQGFDGQFDEGVVGFNADSNSVRSIEDAILKTVNNYRDLANRSLKCVGKFQWESIVEEYIRIYSNVK